MVLKYYRKSDFLDLKGVFQVRFAQFGFFTNNCLTSAHLNVNGTHGTLCPENQSCLFTDVATSDDISIWGPHFSDRATHAAELNAFLQVDTRVHHVLLQPQHVVTIEVLLLEKQLDEVQRHRRP
jgi:hypothetical protein